MPKIITQIEIKRKRKGKKDDQRPIDLAPLPRKIGRRRLFENYIYLRVWDMGQYADGSDRQDLNRYFAFSGNSALVTANPTWNTDILATPYEDWDSIYKEITDSVDDYNIDVGDFDTYVPGKGLRSEQPTPFIPNVHLFAQNKYFTTWLTPASTKVKFTSTPVFSDPAVTFTCSRNCDLFLAPGLHNRYGVARHDPDGIFPSGDETTHAVLTLQAPLPRTLTGSSDFDLIWANRVNSSAADVIDISFYRNLFLNDRGPQMMLTPPGVLVDPNGFPTYSDHPPVEWQTDPRLGFTPATKPGGHLLGAIRKHINETDVEWYFVWSKVAYSPSDPVGIGAFGAWAYGFGESIPGQEHLFGLLV